MGFPEIIRPIYFKEKYELAMKKVDMCVGECNRLQNQLKEKDQKIRKLKRKIKKLKKQEARN